MGTSCASDDPSGLPGFSAPAKSQAFAVKLLARGGENIKNPNELAVPLLSHPSMGDASDKRLLWPTSDKSSNAYSTMNTMLNGLT
jgi:hypothetical protein